MAKKGEISADASAAQAKKNEAHFRKLLKGMHMGHDHVSMRHADYKGHHIMIKTTYQITVDGKPFKAPLGVTDAGSVHYHGMPNASFTSALDLVRCAIDVFPDDFKSGSHGGDHDGHGIKRNRSRRKVIR